MSFSGASPWNSLRQNRKSCIFLFCFKLNVHKYVSYTVLMPYILKQYLTICVVRTMVPKYYCHVAFRLLIICIVPFKSSHVPTFIYIRSRLKYAIFSCVVHHCATYCYFVHVNSCKNPLFPSAFPFTSLPKMSVCGIYAK